MADTPCIFCRIAEERAPAFVVWEDDAHVAFLDRSPIAPGHLIVIPRRHARSVYDLDPAAYAQLFAVVRALAAPVAKVGGAPQAGIAVEGFGVAHAHVHLVPVKRAGDLDPKRQTRAEPAALAEIAARLRSAIAEGGTREAAPVREERAAMHPAREIREPREARPSHPMRPRRPRR